MNKKIKKVFFILVVTALVAVLAASTSFAATDSSDKNKTSGWYKENNFKGGSAELNIKTYLADNYTVNGVYYKNDKKWYTFSTKNKKLNIKSVTIKYQYYDKNAGVYKNTTKTYNGKNKKSITIQIPKYEATVRTGQSTTIYSMGRPIYTIYQTRTQAYDYSVLQFSVKLSNNKKENDRRFSSPLSHNESRIYGAKQTKITTAYKVSLSTSKIVGNKKITFEAKKKSAKIKKIQLKLEYYDSNNTAKYKTVTIAGKNKNTVTYKYPKTYYFYSAKVVY